MSAWQDSEKIAAAKRILVCPLNWGMGHATRCVPIIRQLQAQGKTVIIASDGFPQEFLKAEFPDIEQITFHSYSIHYGSNSQILAMLKCLPNICFGIISEHRKLKKIIAEHNIDTVISDNRFGLWNKCTTSIYITHQLMVKMPEKLSFFGKTVWNIHRFFIKKYDECWIPDDETLKLSGDLSHKYPLPPNARFIGLQSRFSAGIETKPFDYQTIAILSGLEPQRSILENLLTEILHEKKYPSLIVQGKPQAKKIVSRKGNVTFFSHASDSELTDFLANTPILICRSGYSSLMDLHAVGRKKMTLLIPTPGQTEQEYLAKHLGEQKNFRCTTQNNIAEALNALENNI